MVAFNPRPRFGAGWRNSRQRPPCRRSVAAYGGARPDRGGPGVGDVRIESGGEDGSSTFSDINRPIFVKNTINQLMQDKGDGPVRAAATDVVSQLERLEAMLERGTITQDEFDAQKRRLID